MTSSEKRARDADRDLAVEFVKSAWVDGQVTHDEYDERVTRLLRARTLAEVEREVSDLQGPDGEAWRPTLLPAPPPSPRPTPAAPPTPVVEPPAPAAPPAWGVAAGAGLLGLLLLVVIGVSAQRTHEDSAVEGGDRPILAETEGDLVPIDLATLADAVDDEFGTTAVFSVRMTTDHNRVTVVVPGDSTSQVGYESTYRIKARTWSERSEVTAKGERIDLQDVADVDLGLVQLSARMAFPDVYRVVTRVRLGQHRGTPTCFTTTSTSTDGEQMTQHYECGEGDDVS